MRSTTASRSRRLVPDSQPSARCRSDADPSVLLVANRLPVTIELARGRVRTVASVGGLATSMAAIMRDLTCIRIGAANVAHEQLSAQQRMRLVSALGARHRTYPLFLSKPELAGYYLGLSNSVLWPWFHGLRGQTPYPPWWWDAYVGANSHFADTVQSYAAADSLIWVNDYHLCLLPKLLRERGVRSRIGFFLHVPIPEHKDRPTPPFLRSIFHGLLGADLVGVYTQRDKINLTSWLDWCRKAAGTESSDGLGSTRVEVFPIGIDPEHLSDLARSDRSRSLVASLRRALSGVTVLLSVDRLDVTKGTIDKLNAFDQLLCGNPSLRCQVQLILVIAPSRIELPAHVALARNIAEKVAVINDRHGTRSWRPIHYIDRALEQADVVAYYTVADVAVVTPIADGMNLVSKEYLFVRRAAGGRLILTKTAGAANELREAYLVEPGDVAAIAAAMLSALKAAAPVMRHSTEVMVRRLTTQTVHKWAHDFLGTLTEKAV